MRAFDLLQPSTVDEAVSLLQQHGEEARLLGGGAMLSILLRQRVVAPGYLISVTGIPGLDNIEATGEKLLLGSTATLRGIERSTAVKEQAPVLAEALHLVGNVRVRNVATIGGHLAHADIHLDLPPVLTALEATVIVRSLAGERRIPIDDWFVGYYETSLASDEMIVAVEIERQPTSLHGAYLKYCSLSPNDWPTVGVAAFLSADGGTAADVRIVAGSVAERPLRVADAEALLQDRPLGQEAITEVGRMYADAADPLPDVRGSADYKRKVTAVFVRRAIMAAATQAGLSIGE
ncbi:MAG: carbon-monoxide dehydrogenase medium subunit [Chloroflexi bacterium]|nr:carbon-monoxide dehydrogenase medium subunit [Chloroflexota bacterium]